MGIFNQAMITYDNLSDKVGVLEDGKREPLCPICHIIAKAQIEVTITEDGEFNSARIIGKDEEKTIIPVTESSASRSSGVAPHILSDQLSYITKIIPDKKKSTYEKFEKYCSNLEIFINSKLAHKKAMAVFNYIFKERLLDDLIASSIIKKDETGALKGKINSTDYEKCLVRWCVLTNDDTYDECHRDITLFKAWQDYVLSTNGNLDLCAVTGELTISTQNHAKGIVAKDNGAKLVSANDSSGFTYRGRFKNSNEIASIGFVASQKAHLALRYLVANNSVYMGDSNSGRTFLWWSPQGRKLVKFDDFGFKKSDSTELLNYKNELFQTLTGFKNNYDILDDIIVASFEAATTGRLSVTYYNEMNANDFFERISIWYENIAISDYYIPTFKNIIEYAFGRENDNGFFNADGNILKKESQVLLYCMLENRPIPSYYIKTLTTRATKQALYENKSRNRILLTACAIIRKFYNDKLMREEFKMVLDEKNADRSYLFGRYLAVAERLESQTYSNDEKRETNAIRMQISFSQKPFTSFRALEERLISYKAKLPQGSKIYYQNLISEIISKLDIENISELNKPLESIYLLGYYHQREAFFKGKQETKTEENEDE
ncbi:MAG: type I-C CRISPR-associated protein Cas8c/Csd1 [Clostridia bacterium]